MPSATEPATSSTRVARLPRRRRRPEGERSRLRRLFDRMVRTRAAAIFAFGMLIVISFALKVRGLGSNYWIDEGLSVGIGSHSFFHIPAVMREDGSPPLYYMLLHVWMGWFGTTEWATQSMSTLFGLLCIPAAFWAGNTLGGKKAAWAGAALAAVNPFLTIHSYEARMYALMTLLSLLTSTAFVLAYVQGRKRWRIPFGVLLALMLYTHNWALFFAAACVIAIVWLAWRDEIAATRSELFRDAALGFGVTLLLFAPWLPTLIYQALHTGAPWARRPSPNMFVYSLSNTFGGPGPAVALLLGYGASLQMLADESRRKALRIAQTLAIIAGGTAAIAWVFSLVSPAWADRYLAVVAGPAIVLAAYTMTRGRGVMIAALAIALFLQAMPLSVHRIEPGDEQVVATYLKPWMRPGDTVIVTHPERVPIMRHYLGGQLKYGDLFGAVKDPQVMDWRDALDRLKKVNAKKDLAPQLNAVPLHGRVLMVRPIVDLKANSWKAPWTFRVKSQSRHWAHVINSDRRFKVITSWPRPYANLKNGVRGVVYERIH